MTPWILLLRGINVGGHNRLPMKDLRSLIGDLGGRGVASYIQSGNVVFRHTATDAAGLASTIRSAIAAQFGFTPCAHLLTVDELGAAIRANPFTGANTDPNTTHLWFLSGVPPAPDIEGMSAIRRGTEQFRVSGRVCYLYAPDGIARSKLAAGMERLLGVQATARNWRTVTRIRQLADELAEDPN